MTTTKQKIKVTKNKRIVKDDKIQTEFYQKLDPQSTIYLVVSLRELIDGLDMLISIGNEGKGYKSSVMFSINDEHISGYDLKWADPKFLPMIEDFILRKHTLKTKSNVCS